MNWKKNAIVVLICFVVVGITSAIIMDRWSVIKAWGVKKLAIEKPAKVIVETKIEYRDRWHERIIIENPDGSKMTREIAHESSGTTLNANTTSTPIIPEAKKEKTKKRYYLTGGIGCKLNSIDPIYAVGGGVYLCDWLSVGVQVQSNNSMDISGLALITISF